MISRRELESLIGKITDEHWDENCRIMAKLEAEMWEEDHPLDD